MTVQEVALDLLQFIGVTGFSALANDQALLRPGLDTLDTNKALAAINSALQTVQKYGPQAMKQGERAAFFRDAATVHMAVSSSTPQTVSFTTTPPAWCLGCSILIDGDTDLNRITDVEGSIVTLLRGYRGATASGVAATLYSDCAALPSDVRAVLDPVIMTPNRLLRQASSLEEFNRSTGCWREMSQLSDVRPSTGMPSRYYVEARPGLSPMLRLSPIPTSSTNITFEAKLAAERVDVTALAIDGGNDPEVEFSTVAPDDIESVLLPIARWRFFSHPALKNAESRQTVKMEHDAALLALQNGSSMSVSAGPTRVKYI